MLVTNQRLDKLAAAKVDFVNHGMLDPKNPKAPGIVLDCPRVGPGRPSPDFAGPGPGFQGSGQQLLAPAWPSYMRASPVQGRPWPSSQKKKL